MLTNDNQSIPQGSEEDYDETKDPLVISAAGERRRMHDISTAVPMWKEGDPIYWTCCEYILVVLGWLVVLLLPIFWFWLIRTVRSYERAVIFRLGKITGGPKGPGVFIINPLLDEIRVVDLRIVMHDLPPQDMITKDSVTVVVDALCYLKIVNPLNAVLEVDNYKVAFENYAATTLRSVVGSSLLQELLSNRDRINKRLKQIIEIETSNWGVSINAVEIQNVKLPESMQRSMAAEAEAERERRAKVISARGEREAAAGLADAANTIALAPGALQLRYLNTLGEIATEQSSTIVFPLPIELLHGAQMFSDKISLPSAMRPINPNLVLPPTHT